MTAERSGRGSRLFPEIAIPLASSHIAVRLGIGSTAASALMAAAVACCCVFSDRTSRDGASLLPTSEGRQTTIAAKPRRNQVAARTPREGWAGADETVGSRGRLQMRIAEQQEHGPQRGMPDGPEPGSPLRLVGFITADFDQPNEQPALTLITDAPAEPPSDNRSMAEMGRRAVGEFRRLLSSTGLNIERLFPQLGPERAEGGPFVPPQKADQMGGLTQDGLEAMRSLIKSLPLAAPLDSYQLESRFGRRRDPFNRRASFHTGIDLSAPYTSPVYATAPGVVTYAGYRSEYGKVVEIDHGNGISTRYAHLHRSIVSVGQRVAEHTQIGFLGSTGRSSGPHVHYEVLVNDEPQDPEKFIGLARVIPAAAR